MNQLQQIMQQLQDNEEFKNVPAPQLQQMAMQILLKQSPTTLPLMVPPAQPPIQSQAKLSPRYVNNYSSLQLKLGQI